MIAHVRGQIVEKFANSVIVDVNGVGYEVTLTSPDFEQFLLNDTVKIYTYHHIREQSEELFGFSSLEGKKIFELLITVQGVGPKNAMAVLSLASYEEVRNAIANADATYLMKANGIGKKAAERIVVDLREKVGLPSYYGRKTDPTITALPANDEALEALMSLGFQLAEATKALADVDQSLSVEERIRLALKKR